MFKPENNDNRATYLTSFTSSYSGSVIDFELLNVGRASILHGYYS